MRSLRLTATVMSLLALGGAISQVAVARSAEAGRSAPHLAPTPTSAQARAWLLSGDYRAINSAFSAIQAQYRAGTRSDEALYDAFAALSDADESLKPAFDGWVSAYPNSYVAYLARGIYHRKVGQALRGTAVLSETDPSRLQGMDAEYMLAMHDLSFSRSLEPRPLLTLSTELDILADYSEPAPMLAILDESTRIDPSNIVVRRQYLSYLSPRWGGSDEQMADFVRESENAGLPEAKLRALRAVLVEDHALSAKASGNDVTAEREYRLAMQMR